MSLVLITGGGGFIGAHVARELLSRGHEVRALDRLDPQVHPHLAGERPAYLAAEVELRRGDVRDLETVAAALKGVDAVIHLVALVGVGQSMYRVTDYVGTNDLGTAVLLQALIERPVERLVVASSMSIHGEGLYRDAAGRLVEDAERGPDALAAGRWDPHDADGRPLTPLPTPETKRPALTSVYALNKYTQERLCPTVGRADAIPTVALRFFNVYGPHQALSNPYTGVLAIFGSRLLNGRRPMVFEDGQQRRDFVHVRDVARACALALERTDAVGRALNIGSGQAIGVADLGARLAETFGRPDLAPEITGKCRAGDIRHCFADTRLAEALLGFRAETELAAGLAELAAWLPTEIADDRVEQATQELVRRGLVA